MTLTLLNSISSAGSVANVKWIESSSLGTYSDDVSFRVSNEFNSYDPDNVFSAFLRTKLLTVRIQSAQVYWPWSGSMEIMLSINSDSKESASFTGEVNGELQITLNIPLNNRIIDENAKSASFTLRLFVSSPPPRKKRMLWDVFHSISFPSAFVPSDNPSDTRYDSETW